MFLPAYTCDCKLEGTGTATGQHSFAQEQSKLVADRSPQSVILIFLSKPSAPTAIKNESLYSLRGGSSKVDILICTPGRLMDHLNGTPNFSLQHLRFLVRSSLSKISDSPFQYVSNLGYRRSRSATCAIVSRLVSSCISCHTSTRPHRNHGTTSQPQSYTVFAILGCLRPCLSTSVTVALF